MLDQIKLVVKRKNIRWKHIFILSAQGQGVEIVHDLMSFLFLFSFSCLDEIYLLFILSAQGQGVEIVHSG
jgi:hypothetical protein